MVLILLVTLFILAIAFYQVLQGLYSALIMFLLTVVSAMVAFGFYPYLSAYLYQYMSAYTRPVCLVGLFAICLGALRLIYDRFLGANVVLGTWADRIGGGVFGLLTGMVLAGVLTIAIQLLPFTESILTYRPYDEYLQRDHRLHPFRPDEFTLGLMSMLSDGSMGGSADFDDAHGNLLLEAHCFRNTAGKNGSRLAKPESLQSAEAYARLPGGIDFEDDVPHYPLADRGAQRPIVVRVELGAEVADEDDWYRVPGTQVQLTTIDDQDELHDYYPVAFLTGRMRDHDDGEAWVPAEGWKLHTPPDYEDEGGDPKLGLLAVERKKWRDEDTLTIDWVYSVPEGETPVSVTFRAAASRGLGEPEDMRPPTENALTRSGDKPRR
jgi:uncharacterized membrane protein required for colicin V production